MEGLQRAASIKKKHFPAAKQSHHWGEASTIVASICQQLLKRDTTNLCASHSVCLAHFLCTSTYKNSLVCLLSSHMLWYFTAIAPNPSRLLSTQSPNTHIAIPKCNSNLQTVVNTHKTCGVAAAPIASFTVQCNGDMLAILVPQNEGSSPHGLYCGRPADWAHAHMCVCVACNVLEFGFLC